MFPSGFDARHGVRDHVTDLVTVTKWERLTPEDYSRNVFHIEMDTTNTAIKYRIGEALVVFAHNDDKAVVKFLQSCGCQCTGRASDEPSVPLQLELL
ncbi:putative sulfite reductase [NADPH] flavoprotein component [Phytophthora citrophthora]|uniref:Sulfite reductase [NADPH] flavoprotein component n=1 Tax=Phytophthora citrophthora TaxID=4793 RepID=A0AAD9LBC3_9STRA|nr:putative sulfite reductase [NADPH] flavoprotein component [Phytophthora citrophthora]